MYIFSKPYKALLLDCPQLCQSWNPALERCPTFYPSFLLLYHSTIIVILPLKLQNNRSDYLQRDGFVLFRSIKLVVVIWHDGFWDNVHSNIRLAWMELCARIVTGRRLYVSVDLIVAFVDMMLSGGTMEQDCSHHFYIHEHQPEGCSRVMTRQCGDEGCSRGLANQTWYWGDSSKDLIASAMSVSLC